MIAAYRFLSAAHEEVAEAIEHYNKVASDAAAAFLSDLDRAIDLLRVFPRSGVTVEYGFRSFPLHQFPFTVIYAIDDNDIIIVAVAHQSRQPQYWINRLND